MGHGTHWEAVLNNVEEDFGNAITLAAQQSELRGRRTIPNWNGPLGISDAVVTVLEGRHSGFSAIGLVVSAAGKTYLHSAFPTLSANCGPYAARIQNIQECSFGLEARITADIGNASVTFFDPYYALSRERYLPGENALVGFMAVAHTVSSAMGHETVQHPEVGEISLHGAAILLPLAERAQSNPAERGYGLAYITEPQSGPDIDDYQFRALVTSVITADFLGRKVLRFRATLMRPEENQDFDVQVGVLVRSGDEEQIRPGLDISGSLWLQGTAL